MYITLSRSITILDDWHKVLHGSCDPTESELRSWSKARVLMGNWQEVFTIWMLGNDMCPTLFHGSIRSAVSAGFRTGAQHTTVHQIGMRITNFIDSVVILTQCRSSLFRRFFASSFW